MSTSTFAERLVVLRRDAGQPTYESIERGVRQELDPGRKDPRGRPVRAPSYQRISAWVNGENVPSSWPQCELVLRYLIERARRAHPRPAVDGLYGLAAWEALWRAARKAPAAGPDVCPYRGLEAFQAEHAAYFFGRAGATDELVTRLGVAAAGGGPLMLVAPSGAGKSSLLRAGLLPAVRDGALGDRSWRTLVVTPGPDPVTELADRVGPPDPGTRLLLVVDQFEELFTLCEDEARRREFVERLHRLTTDPGGAVSVVIAVRADFYARCLDHPRLAEALQARQMLLAPMTAAELAEAVTGPATAVGLRLEPGLVELLLSDAGVDRESNTDPGILPLVSHALAATWQQRRKGGLTLEGYRTVGGIASAVEATAERAWAELDDEGRRAGESLLLMLTRIGGDGIQHTRARRDIGELLRRCADRAGAEEALQTLAGARLVTLDAESAQFAHEAILGAWPRLRTLVEAHRETLLLRQRVEDDAAAWADGQRDGSLLYRGARLETAREWERRAELDGPGDTAREFLAASAQQHRRQRRIVRAGVALGVVLALVAGVAALVARTQRNDALYDTVLAQADRLRDTDPSTSARLDLVAHRMRPDDRTVDGRLLSTQNVPLASMLPGRAGSIYGVAYSPDGHTLATAAESRQVRLWDVTDPAHVRPVGAALSAGPDGWAVAVAFSPDGHTLVATDNVDRLQLWDVRDRAHPVPLGVPLSSANSPHAIAFSPDGRTLASAGTRQDQPAGPGVTLWNLADPAHPALSAQFPVPGSGGLNAVAFSPAGGLLATGGGDGSLGLWNVADPTHPAQVGTPVAAHDGELESLAFAPSGRVLASGGDDKRARLWDVGDPARPVPLGPPLDGGQSQVYAVSFSPVGNLLLTGCNCGVVRLWDVADPAHASRVYGDLATGNSGVYTAAFAPDGRSLAVGAADGSAAVWSLPATVLVGHGSRVLTLAYGAGGRLLASGGGDHEVLLWNVGDPARPATFGPPLPADGDVHTLALSPRGDLLAVAGGDTVQLWNIADPGHPARLPGPPVHTVESHLAAFSPDGRVLATAGIAPAGGAADAADRLVQLWDVRDPARIRPLGPPLGGNTQFIYAVVFSPDGRLLATSGEDAAVRLWDVHDPAAAVPVGAPLAPGVGSLAPVVISPDGRTLAAAGESPEIQRWDLADPARPMPLPALAGHTEFVTSLSFSPDGRRLVSGSVDRTIRLWTLSGPGGPAAATLGAQQGTVEAVAFGPGGTTLASASDDNTVMLWDLDVARSVRRICATTQGALPESRWNQLLPQLPYNPPC